MQRFDPVSALAALGNLTGLLRGGDTLAPASGTSLPPPVAEDALRRAGLDGGTQDGMPVSTDIAALLRMKPGARDNVTRTSTSAATTTVSPDQARYQGMTVRQLLQELARCAATFGGVDCLHLNIYGLSGYHAKLEQMVAALQALPDRRTDLARLHNAYFALHRGLHRLRHLVMEIGSVRADLDPLLEGWAADLAVQAIDLALALPLDRHGREIQDPARYPAVIRTIMEPLPFHIATLKARRTALAIEQARQDIDGVFEVLYAPGNRQVDGAAVDVQRGPEPGWLTGGLVRIRGDEKTLLWVLRSIPGARLDPAPPVFGAYDEDQPPYKGAYPGDSGIRSVYWRSPDGTEYPVLVHVGTGAGQSYSLDGGSTWRLTGSPSNPNLQSRRIARWGQFVEHRRQDATWPFWKQIYRGRFTIAPLPV